MVPPFEDNYINQWKKCLLNRPTFELEHYRDMWSNETNRSENTQTLLDFVVGLIHDRSIHIPGTKIPYEYDPRNYCFESRSMTA